MLPLENIAAFLLASLLVILVPGPATIFVAGEASMSRTKAWFATAGIIIGDIVLIAVSGLGFAALVIRWPSLIVGIKFFGALYIGYLGMGLWLSANQQNRPMTSKPSKDASWRILVKGILLTLTNPKPILFFSAFFPIFLTKESNTHISGFYLLGLIFEGVNITYFCTLILGISYITTRFQRHAHGLKINRISGACLMGFAVVLIASTVRDWV